MKPLGIKPMRDRPRFGDQGITVDGPLSALQAQLMPSPYTEGWMRWLDIGLTVLAFPFFAMSLISLIFLAKRWGKVPVIDWLFGALFATVFLTPCLMTQVDFGTAFQVTLSLGGVWFLRGVLRWVAYARSF